MRDEGRRGVLGSGVGGGAASQAGVQPQVVAQLERGGVGGVSCFGVLFAPGV